MECQFVVDNERIGIQDYEIPGNYEKLKFMMIGDRIQLVETNLYENVPSIPREFLEKYPLISDEDMALMHEVIYEVVQRIWKGSTFKVHIRPVTKSGLSAQ